MLFFTFMRGDSQAQILPVAARKGDEQVGRTLFFDKCNKMFIFLSLP